MKITTIRNNKNKILLNPFIFNLVSIFLIYNDSSSHNRLLELSLLSKQTFKLFQNLLISYDLNNLKFIIPTKNQFIKYIQNNDDSGDYYKNKLIQYKSLESIKLYFNGQDKDGDIIDFDNYTGGAFNYESLLEIKETILKYCPLLKRIKILNLQFLNSNSVIQDYTFNGFFKFKRLWCLLLNGNLIHSQFNTSSTENNGNDQQQQVNPFEIQYSFKQFENCKPSKFIFDSHCSNSFTSINNILDLKSIKSISFEKHSTPLNFIVPALKSIHIKSLILKLQVTEDTGVPFTSSLLKVLTDGNIGTSNHLTKLIIDSHNIYKINNIIDQDTDFKSILNLITLNKSIKSFGIPLFKIGNCSMLSPLIGNSNISKLTCNIINLQVVLNHCNLNNNIKQLNIIYSKLDKVESVDNDQEYQNYNSILDSMDLNSIFSNFFNNINVSFLQKITISFEISKSFLINFKTKQLIDIYENSKSFKMLDFKFKNKMYFLDTNNN